MVRISIAALVIASSALVSCTNPTNNIIDPNGKVDHFSDTTDYFPSKVAPESGSHFSVEYHKHWKYATNKFSNQTFVLYQRGTPKPKAVTDKDIFFEVPVNKIATVTTTTVSYLEMLGLRERIKYVESEDLITSSCVLDLVHEKKITPLPNYSKGEAAKIDDKAWENVDIIFDDEPFNNKTVAVEDYEAPGVLRRTEWLDFFSIFFNLEKTANQVTGDIFNNYNCIKKQATAKTKDPKPVVAWASYVAPYPGYNSQPYYQISTAIYKANLTQDAGAAMVAFNESQTWKKYSGEHAFAFETADKFHAALKTVDFLIDESDVTNNTFPNFEDILKLYKLSSKDTDYKFIKNKAIYREDLVQSKAGGLDWLSNGIVMADAALEDVVNMIDPNFHKDYDFHWFRNITGDEEVEIVTDDECKDPKATLKSVAYQCAKAGDSKSGDHTSNGMFKPVLSATSIIMTLVAITLAL
ncbi:hypothetical protein K7432_012802 [Basidiobolus ranarum]|uniref:Periplasmic binding protein n=1 Tax=Basidiobolus ranarum TaxID=34480 RepID=A0ABR2VRP6_9FUNG